MHGFVYYPDVLHDVLFAREAAHEAAAVDVDVRSPQRKRRHAEEGRRPRLVHLPHTGHARPIPHHTSLPEAE